MLFLLGCLTGKTVEEPPSIYEQEAGPYDVEIRWTSYGIPHIKAQDYGSLGFGSGYALARDHACTLMDQIVRIRGERSLYHGPEHIDSDIGWKALDVVGKAEEGFSKLGEDIQKNMIGYISGFNHYITENPTALPEACAGGAWIRDFTHIDLLAYYLALGMIASGGNFAEAIGQATPPNQQNRPLPPHADLLNPPEMGSNGWAIGSQKSETGGGLVLSNTHFPYWGERRWHESHLTIPGQLDVYGSSLVGISAINIGFNRSVAWTHTVSTAPRFVVYTLDLDEDDPTRYIYDGEFKQMEEYPITISVLQEDGTIEEYTKSTYKSMYGWVFNAPTFGWPDAVAFSFRDTNENNLNMLATWFDMNRATSMDEFKKAQETHMGIPWVYTMAADNQGNAWFIDSSAVPNFTTEAEEKFFEEELAQNPFSSIFWKYNVIAVSGKDSTYHWEEETGSRIPGLVPFSQAPQLSNSSYVFNANDSHWLSNVQTPLEGYSFVYGTERTGRSPRTRMNARFLEEESSWNKLKIQEAALSGRAILEEEIREEFVAHCSQNTELVQVEYKDELQDVDIAPACAALAQWDGTFTTQAQGAQVWRETLGAEIFDQEDLWEGGDLFSTSFNPEAPVNTPTGLAIPQEEERDYLLESMALATLRLQEANIAVDAPLEDIQFQKKDGEKIPIMGSAEWEGTLSIAVHSGGNVTLIPKEDRAEQINGTTDLTLDGYQVNYGNSWVASISMDGDTPTCEAIMSYGQSSDPQSPHFTDQSLLYRDSRFRSCIFEESDISSNADLVEVSLHKDTFTTKEISVP